MSWSLPQILVRFSSWMAFVSGYTLKPFWTGAFLFVMPASNPNRQRPFTRSALGVVRPSGASSKNKSSTLRAKKLTSTKQSPVEEVNVTSCADSNPATPWYSVFTKGDEQYNLYMATEWAFEKRGDEALFEKLSLEGAQSGLSWLTVLRKRDAYRRVFHGFNVDRVARMTEKDVVSILDETSDDTRDIIVRHRGKVESVINNAKCIQRIREENGNEAGAFDKLLWSFVDDAPILNAWDGNLANGNSKSDESIAMSKALKKLGFRFVGPTTCYALMQSVGMVIDHPVDSPEWEQAYERLQWRSGGYQDRRSIKSISK